MLPSRTQIKFSPIHVHGSRGVEVSYLCQTGASVTKPWQSLHIYHVSSLRGQFEIENVDELKYLGNKSSSDNLMQPWSSAELSPAQNEQGWARLAYAEQIVEGCPFESCKPASKRLQAATYLTNTGR